MSRMRRTSYTKGECWCLSALAGPEFTKINHWTYENGARYCHFCKTYESMSHSSYLKLYRSLKKGSFRAYRAQQLEIVSKAQGQDSPVLYVMTRKGVEHCLAYLNKNFDFSKVTTFIHDEYMFATGFMCRACLLATLSYKTIKEIKVADDPDLILKKGVDFKIHRIKISEAIFNTWEDNFKKLLNAQYWIERPFSSEILYCTSIQNYIPNNALIRDGNKVIFSTKYSPDQLYYPEEPDFEEFAPASEQKDLHTPNGE